MLTSVGLLLGIARQAREPESLHQSAVAKPPAARWSSRQTHSKVRLQSWLIRSLHDVLCGQPA